MKRAMLLGAALAAITLSGCGVRQDLKPQKGEALPVAPYGAAKAPTPQDLLKPSNQARPARSDELLRNSEDRRSDDYDLPPN
jgi:hypothetical protein